MKTKAFIRAFALLFAVMTAAFCLQYSAFAVGTEPEIDVNPLLNSGGWTITDGRIKYLKSGEYLCGKHEIDGMEYTFDEDGLLIADNIFITIDEKTYYIVNNLIVKSTIIIHENYVYLLDENGCRYSGRYGIYTFGEDGKLIAENGYISIGTTAYHLVNNKIVETRSTLMSFVDGSPLTTIPSKGSEAPYIINVPDGMTAAEFLEQLDGMNVVPVGRNGHRITDMSKLLGTGDTVYLMDENNYIYYFYRFIIKGDADGDGKMTAKDAAYLLRLFANWNLERIDTAFDFNGDGKVSAEDATVVLRKLAGWKVTIY